MLQVIGPVSWPQPGWALKDKAASWAIQQQMNVGVDIFTDGAQRRESLMWHVVKNAMHGVDFEYRTLKPQKGCKDLIEAPTVTKRVTTRQLGLLVEDLRFLQRKVKKQGRTMMFIPGPMTIVDSLCGT